MTSLDQKITKMHNMQQLYENCLADLAEIKKPAKKHSLILRKISTYFPSITMAIGQMIVKQYLRVKIGMNTSLLSSGKIISGIS